MTLTKTDITGAKTVPGAKIEVRNEQGEMIYRATTDANGEIPDIPVTPGTYAFREILAPSGYALNEAETRFTVDEQGNVTGNTMLRDDYTRVQLPQAGRKRRAAFRRRVCAGHGNRYAPDDRRFGRKRLGDV